MVFKGAAGLILEKKKDMYMTGIHRKLHGMSQLLSIRLHAAFSFVYVFVGRNHSEGAAPPAETFLSHLPR